MPFETFWLNLACADPAKSAAFYRALGLSASDGGNGRPPCVTFGKTTLCLWTPDTVAKFCQEETPLANDKLSTTGESGAIWRKLTTARLLLFA